MRRREFIGLLSGLAICSPLPMRAEQPGRVRSPRRIAIAHASSPISQIRIDGDNPLISALFDELAKLGYVEGKNLEIIRFSANGRTNHFKQVSEEIVKSGPELIVANTSAFVRSLKETTQTIPIVGITADPIAYGLTKSLSRPEGNVTGVSVDAGIEIWGKRLAILREILPSANRIGFLTIRASWDGPQGQNLSRAARDIGATVLGPPLDDPVQPPEYRRVLDAMRSEKADAVIVGDASANFTYRKEIVALTNDLRLPTMFPYREFVDEGGLVAYAVEARDLWRRAADSVDELLRGAKVNDVPFFQASTFRLIINIKAAQRLGLIVPPSLSLRADEVIE
jgi:putative tryptophan/tyrosine transport system substrate-binding protein